MKLGGLISAVHTPFFSDFRLDIEGMKKNLQYLIEKGLDGVMVTGTAGEFVSLTFDERIRIWKTSKEVCDNKILLIAHTGDNSTSKTMELTKLAEETGIEYAMIICPYVVKPTQQEIFEYYSYLAQNTKISLIIYNNPGRTGVTIQANTLIALAEFKNIVGVKDSTRDLRLIMEVIYKTKDKNFAVLCGEADLIIPTMALGAKGAIITPTLINPDPFIHIYRETILNNLETANEYQHMVLPLLNCLVKEKKFHAAVKAGVEMMGRPAGPPRPPLQAISDELKEELQLLLLSMFKKIDKKGG